MFRNMWTKRIVEVAFVIGLAALGFTFIYGVLFAPSDVRLPTIIGSLVGVLFLRVFCESVIVIFEIHHSLKTIEARLVQEPVRHPNDDEQ